MTVIRRESALSSDASLRSEHLYRITQPRFLQIVPDFSASLHQLPLGFVPTTTLLGGTWLSLLLEYRPDIPDELPSHGNNHLLGGFSVKGHSTTSFPKSLLSPIGDRDDADRLILSPLP